LPTGRCGLTLGPLSFDHNLKLLLCFKKCHSGVGSVAGRNPSGCLLNNDRVHRTVFISQLGGRLRHSSVVMVKATTKATRDNSHLFAILFFLFSATSSIRSPSVTRFVSFSLMTFLCYHTF